MGRIEISNLTVGNENATVSGEVASISGSTFNCPGGEIYLSINGALDDSAFGMVVNSTVTATDISLFTNGYIDDLTLQAAPGVKANGDDRPSEILLLAWDDETIQARGIIKNVKINENDKETLLCDSVEISCKQLQDATVFATSCTLKSIPGRSYENGIGIFNSNFTGNSIEVEKANNISNVTFAGFDDDAKLILDAGFGSNVTVNNMSVVLSMHYPNSVMTDFTLNGAKTVNVEGNTTFKGKLTLDKVIDSMTVTINTPLFDGVTGRISNVKSIDVDGCVNAAYKEGCSLMSFGTAFLFQNNAITIGGIGTHDANSGYTYILSSTGELEFRNNTQFVVSENILSGTNSAVLYVGQGSKLEIIENDKVEFSLNSSSNKQTLPYAIKSDTTNPIILCTKNIDKQTVEGNYIRFYQPVSLSGDLYLNGDEANANGNGTTGTVTGTGEILFSGKKVDECLWQGIDLQSRISARTSTVSGNVYLNGGSLRVDGGLSSI